MKKLLFAASLLFAVLLPLSGLAAELDWKGTVGQDTAKAGAFSSLTTSATIADNTTDTQTATTAYAKSQDAVLANPKAMAQGVAMTAATSGSSGITVADNDNLDISHAGGATNALHLFGYLY